MRRLLLLLAGAGAAVVLTVPAVASNDPLFSHQWGLGKIQAETAWKTTTGGGVIVAVIDTGVDLSHPDLAGRVIAGHDYVNGDESPQDDNKPGHGTHVAGIVAAVSGNGIGVAGVAPGAKVLAMKVLDSSGVGNSGDVAAAIRAAADGGAGVINLSLGDPLDPVGSGLLHNDTTDAAVEYAYNHNVVVVAAAGNDGVPFKNPAVGAMALTVGATDSSDSKAVYSGSGTGVRIYAPGGAGTSPFCDDDSDIWSTVRQGQGCSSDGNYTTLAGTSMATPHVSGVAALVRAANPALSAAQVMDVLVRSSDLISGGLKRVNAANAVSMAKASTGTGGTQGSGGSGSSGGGGSPSPSKTSAGSNQPGGSGPAGGSGASGSAGGGGAVSGGPGGGSGGAQFGGSSGSGDQAAPGGGGGGSKGGSGGARVPGKALFFAVGIAFLLGLGVWIVRAGSVLKGP